MRDARYQLDDTARPPARMPRLLVGLAAVFALFHWLAGALGSDRGQAGLIVAAAVVAATVAVRLLLYGQRPAAALGWLGLGRPAARGLVASAVVCLALVLTIPVLVVAGRLQVSGYPGWPWLLPGLFAQAGLAEEVLFRGYLFHELRSGRSFWRAALLSTGPFALVHLLMFATMPWPVALASLGLAIVVSFPLAHLFELGGNTVWAPALMHFVIQGALKVATLSGDLAGAMPIIWIVACAVLPFGVFLWRRP